VPMAILWQGHNKNIVFVVSEFMPVIRSPTMYVCALGARSWRSFLWSSMGASRVPCSWLSNLLLDVSASVRKEGFAEFPKTKNYYQSFGLMSQCVLPVQGKVSQSE
jgi:hypothetical protein